MNGVVLPPLAVPWLPSNSFSISPRRLGEGDICCCMSLALRTMLATGMSLGRPKARLHRFSIIKAAKGIDPLAHFSWSAAKARARSLLLVAVLVLVLEDLLQAEIVAHGIVLLLLLVGRRPRSSSSLSSCGIASCIGGKRRGWGGRLAHVRLDLVLTSHSKGTLYTHSLTQPPHVPSTQVVHGVQDARSPALARNARGNGTSSSSSLPSHHTPRCCSHYSE